MKYETPVETSIECSKTHIYKYLFIYLFTNTMFGQKDDIWMTKPSVDTCTTIKDDDIVTETLSCYKCLLWEILCFCNLSAVEHGGSSLLF